MPLVIPVFIPHQGCPHACIFCNQHRISGQGADIQVTPSVVEDIISLWLKRGQCRVADVVQVAFYGGSFTGLPILRQQELLQAVGPFLCSGQVQSVRLSTRPDYIDSDKVAFLQAHGVATVELGVQSLDDNVLSASCRGHKAADTYKAVEYLRQGGMKIGLQLMLGLPNDSTRSLMQTVKKVAALRPDFVRIYPVLVLQGSRLNDLCDEGTYSPLSLKKAVVLASWMKKYFDAHCIRVVRMGLQAAPELEKSMIAGPYHPSFGELVNARIMLQKTRKALQGVSSHVRQTLSISNRDISIFRGVNSSNIRRLEELGLDKQYTLITNSTQPRFTLQKVNTVSMQTNYAQC